VQITVAPSPATTGTSFGIADADDALQPDVFPHWVVAVPHGEIPTRTNSEILKVTNSSSSGGTTTKTIVRQQGIPATTAKSIAIGWDIYDANSAEANLVLNADTVDGYHANATPEANKIPVLDSAMAMITPSLFRQALINGNFDVWQRGTSIAMTAANAYTADRWYAETATAGTDKTVSRQDGTGVEGSYYCARVAMVGDVDELLTFSQALESQDSIKFRGKKLTLSFYARGGAEFVADNPTLVCKIRTGKGTDQKVLAFTTLADAISADETLTTGWQKFTITTTNVIASDITQIGISFAFTHAGAGVTTNYFEVTQVQLCAGGVALPFMPKSFEDELRACQRYYERFGGDGINVYKRFGNGLNYSTTINAFILEFKVPKRISTYTLETTGTAANYAVYHGSDTVTQASSVPALNATSKSYENAYVLTTVSSGLTAGAYGMTISDNNNSTYLAINAEL